MFNTTINTRMQICKFWMKSVTYHAFAFWIFVFKSISHFVTALAELALQPAFYVKWLFPLDLFPPWRARLFCVLKTIPHSESLWQSIIHYNLPVDIVAACLSFLVVVSYWTQYYQIILLSFGAFDDGACNVINVSTIAERDQFIVVFRFVMNNCILLLVVVSYWTQYYQIILLSFAPDLKINILHNHVYSFRCARYYSTQR